MINTASIEGLVRNIKINYKDFTNENQFYCSVTITQMTIHFTVIYRNHLNILNRMSDAKSPSYAPFSTMK
jgi:hypothetical protein